MNARTPAEERWVVILVHGVGETEPADMIDAVAPVVTAVQDPTRTPSDGYEEVQLPDEGDQTFPVFMRRDQVNAAQVLFAEVFWADLSRIRQGTLALLVGLYHLVFSVRYIADQGSAQPGPLAAILRLLLRTAAFLLRGPMFALYALATADALVYMLAESLRQYGVPVDLRTAPAAAVVFGVLGLTAAVVGLILAWRTRGSLFFTAPPWMALAVVGLLASALAILVLTQPGTPVLRLLFRVVHYRYPILQRHEQAEFYVAAALLGAKYVLWTIAGLLLAALVPLLLAWLVGRLELRPALAGAYLAGALQTLLWVLVVAPLNFVSIGAVTLQQPADQAKPYWNDLFQYFTFQTALIMLLAITATAVLVVRTIWSLRRTAADWPAHQVPRLIVAAAVAFTLLAVSVLFFLFTLEVPFTTRFDWPLPNAVAAFTIWLVLVLLIAAVHLAPSPLRNVLHVVMDVINHFRTKGGRFIVRERIDHRFQSVLQYVLAREQPTHLFVIAHSQGTVITLNSLQLPACQAALKQAALPPANVRLATFGSPYTHLYQYYFPAQYPPEPGRVILLPTFGAWVNLFRIDDYVGTQVNGEPDVDRPRNIPLAPGFLQAHTSYWQTGVLALIKDLLPGAATPALPPGP